MRVEPAHRSVEVLDRERRVASAPSDRGQQRRRIDQFPVLLGGRPGRDPARSDVVQDSRSERFVIDRVRDGQEATSGDMTEVPVRRKWCFSTTRAFRLLPKAAATAPTAGAAWHAGVRLRPPFSTPVPAVRRARPGSVGVARR
jgi:hypothetical protein